MCYFIIFLFFAVSFFLVLSKRVLFCHCVIFFGNPWGSLGKWYMLGDHHLTKYVFKNVTQCAHGTTEGVGGEAYRDEGR